MDYYYTYYKKNYNLKQLNKQIFSFLNPPNYWLNEH